MDVTTPPPSLDGLPPLHFPGVDLPHPAEDTASRVAHPKPTALVDAVQTTLAREAGRATPTAQLVALDSQHRLRCKTIIDVLGWTDRTSLTAWTDAAARLMWLQAEPAPCPHVNCLHEHEAEELPGQPEPFAGVGASVYDERRLRLPPGGCHWVGTGPGQPALLIARPELDAVLVTSVAAVDALLDALVTPTSTLKLAS